MKQIFLSKNGIETLEVPEPKIKENELLVINHFSCISPGTELAGIKSLRKNIFKKIIEKPEKLKQVFDSLKKSGISNTSKIIKNKLNMYYELGYSSVGIIKEIGANVKKFNKGDFVACCGGGFASHAELINVPENLAVKVNKNKKLNIYSSVALGSISLQSVRRLEPTIGENILVVGLGLIGQITIQILEAAGINVYAVDPNKEFVKKARDNGFVNIFYSLEELKKHIKLSELEVGFDGSIITASSESDKVLSDTFNLSRRKSRVVVVGNIGLNINRNEIYKKEIDFLISTSYGPGRYDYSYEIEGIDYPRDYVRWTLNRNMQAYVDLIEKGKIDLSNLLNKTGKIEDSKSLYEEFSKVKRPISILINYTRKKNTKEYI